MAVDIDNSRMVALDKGDSIKASLVKMVEVEYYSSKPSKTYVVHVKYADRNAEVWSRWDSDEMSYEDAKGLAEAIRCRVDEALTKPMNDGDAQAYERLLLENKEFQNERQEILDLINQASKKNLTRLS